MHISVCICTFRRPAMLEKLLLRLAEQRIENCFSYSVTVIDNDNMESGRTVVAKLRPAFPVPLEYSVEPRRSISHARNKSIAESQGDLIAFIDDDEVPTKDWLRLMVATLTLYDCSGVLGPVNPEYPDGTPDWVAKSRLFERPSHETGYVVPWPECRSGNALFRRAILPADIPPLNPDFGTGGSDVDFFRRMIEAGYRFVWCHEAPVTEVVPPSRWSRRNLFRRALLRGRNAFRLRRGRTLNLVKSLVAVPSYCAALPILQLFGHHRFVRYFIKLGDHLGYLLASFGIEFVSQRPM